MPIIIFKDFKNFTPGNHPGRPIMAHLLIRWLCLTGAIIFAAYVVDGISATGFFSALFAAAALGILNLFFRPILLILTLPINILSLGLFTFVINALMLKMASAMIPGFTVTGFWAAVFGAIIISIAAWFLNMLLRDAAGPGRPVGPGDQRTRSSDETIDLNRKDNRWE
jgi:putative membrane protein